MSVSIKLHNDSSRVEEPLQKTDTKLSVEPFSPRKASRHELEELHSKDHISFNNETKEVHGLASLGLWGLGIGLLSILFAYKRLSSSNKKPSTKAV